MIDWTQYPGNRCKGTTAKGTQCAQGAGSGEYCLIHKPAMIIARKEKAAKRKSEEEYHA